MSHNYSEYYELLTTGKVYTVTAGFGDVSMFGTLITHVDGWESEHDNGMSFYQRELEGSHGVFELVD